MFFCQLLSELSRRLFFSEGLSDRREELHLFSSLWGWIIYTYKLWSLLSFFVHKEHIWIDILIEMLLRTNQLAQREKDISVKWNHVPPENESFTQMIGITLTRSKSKKLNSMGCSLHTVSSSLSGEVLTRISCKLN